MPADNEAPERQPPSGAEIYRHAIEEYRFEVQLSWERTKFYLGLNMALLAAVATLLRIESDSWFPLIGISLVGVLASGLGISTIRNGHEYYRRTIWKKTLIEEALGLNRRILSTPADQGGTWAIATTKSQGNAQDILQDTDAWLARRMRLGTVTGKLVVLMRLFIFLHVLVILFAGCQLWPHLVICCVG